MDPHDPLPVDKLSPLLVRLNAAFGALLLVGLAWILVTAATPLPWAAVPFVAGLVALPVAIRRGSG